MQIERAAIDPRNSLTFPIVELADFAAIPAAPPRMPSILTDSPPPPTDLIGPGDTLDIVIYESGVTLFGGDATKLGDVGAALSPPSSRAERLPSFRVDDNGYIRIPFAGPVMAAGKTASELSAAIRNALLGMSQTPQVLVTIRDTITNSVIIGGEVSKPGRLALPTNRETLSDAIALAGGYRGEAKDVAVRIQRRDRNAEFRLSDILRTPGEDFRVYPGDRITLVRAPRTFSVMGAPGRVEQLPFSDPSISLTEALSLAGGANPNLGDPKAIFVFRFVQDENGVEKPIVYHLNMMLPGAFFVGQRFAMRDKDVLYIGNAEANQPSKLIQLISQLFAPLVTVRDISRTGF
jgi:polysaccharide export outer membrane protein